MKSTALSRRSQLTSSVNRALVAIVSRRHRDRHRSARSRRYFKKQEEGQRPDRAR